MARHLFGLSPADLAMERVGELMYLRGGVSGSAWDSLTGGTQYTDLTDLGGNATDQVVADTDGGVGFYGPDGVGVVYVDFGYSKRFLMQANDLGPSIETLSTSKMDRAGGTFTGPVVFPGGASIDASGNATLNKVSLPRVRRISRHDFLTTSPGLWTDVPGNAFTVSQAQTSTQPSSTIGWRPPLVTLAGSGNTAEQRAPWSYVGTLASDIALSDTVSPGNGYVVSTALQPHLATNTNNSWGVRFRSSAQVIYIRYRYMATSNAIQILVDGRRLWDVPKLINSIATVGTPGNSHILTLDLGSVKSRDIQLEFAGAPFWGVYTGVNYPVVGSTAKSLHLCGYGDSITGGSNVNSGGAIGTWLFRLGHRMGCDRITNASRGGTGFVATNSPYTALTDPNRYNDDVVAKKPDIVLCWAGYNDDGSAGSQTAWQAAVDTVLNGLKTGLPNALIVLVGGYSPTGTWGTYTIPASLVSKDSWGRARATAAGVPFISPITGDVLAPDGTVLGNLGPWITGSGHVTATSGFGNADWAVGSSTDAVHPTDAGHEHISHMMFDALELILAA